MDPKLKTRQADLEFVILLKANVSLLYINYTDLLCNKFSVFMYKPLKYVIYCYLILLNR